MTVVTQDRRSYGFAIGLLTGTFVGAGLAIWLTPRMTAERRERMTNSAKGLGRQASEQYEQASSRVGEVVSELITNGEDPRDEFANAVARGAHEVERYAVAAKNDRSATGSVERNVVSSRNG